MSSQVYYRKWRPQSFTELVGQEHVTRTLLNALASGRVAHAYLFSGPRGTGKTSTGRLLAKAVNCLENGQGEPCNACAMCRAISQGRALDLVEIDAASNRGIDEIRDLREKVNFAPNQARYKVYIIDEVHMLTEFAFNALLKTLEEPPPHAIFVLATTEVHKVPATILSRCQRFDFRRLPLAAVVKRLEQVCGGEGLEVEPGVLELVARSATGSLRDAENILEQLEAYHGSKIGLAQAQALLGISGDARSWELLKQILGKEIAQGLTTLGSVVGDGLDLRQFHRELLDHLRALLLVKAGAEVDLTREAQSELAELARGVSLGEISRALHLFGSLELRGDATGSLPFELALVEYALSEEREERAATLTPQAEGSPGQPEVAEREPSQPQPQPPPPREPSLVAAATSGDEQRSQTPPSASATPAPKAASSDPVEQLRLNWEERIVPECRQVNRNAGAFLQNCEPQAVEEGVVILGARNEGIYKYWQNLLQNDTPRSRSVNQAIETTLSKVLGSPHQVRCVLMPGEHVAPARPSRESPLVRAAREMGARIIDEED